jgi:hypothetical protein
MKDKIKSKLDYMKEAEFKEEDALYPEEIAQREETEREKYFSFYDDIKTNIKEDW